MATAAREKRLDEASVFPHSSYVVGGVSRASDAMSYHFTDIEKGRLLNMKENSVSSTECARRLGRSTKAVRRWWRRYEDGGEEGMTKRKSTGRKKVTTTEEDAAIVSVSSASF